MKFKNFCYGILFVCSLFFLFGAFFWTQKEAVLEKMARFLAIPSSVRKADLIVALGDSEERKAKAVNLLKKDLAPKVLFTGPHIEPSHYQMFGVPNESIFDPAPPNVHSTYEEAMAIRSMAEKKSLQSILIVTSFFHLKRTAFTFRRVFEKSNIQLLFASVRTPEFNEHNWWENSSHRRGIFREYLALVYYWLTV